MPSTVTWTIDGGWADYVLPWSNATFTWDSGGGLTWEQATYTWDAFPFRWNNTSAETAPVHRTMDIPLEDRTMVITDTRT